MNFKATIILENERVLLRPLVKEDFQYLLPFSINESTLWTYSLVPANGKENLEQYIQKAITDKNNQTAYPFIVFDKKTGTYAGSTRFYDYQTHHQTTQLGYTWYGQDFQRTGLNRNCKYLMLQYAFEVLKLERVEFRADNNNSRSITAMKAIGCKVEGVLRQNCASLTGRRDSIILSILKEEWFNGVKENLKNKL